MTFALALLGALPQLSQAAHSAHALWGQDQVDPALSGTSNPAGIQLVNVNGSTPGYLNGIFIQSIGSVSLAPPPQSAPELVGVAIHLTDTAGPSHSLSDMNDPALGDVLLDLRQGSSGDAFYVSVYPYLNAPQQYADAQSILSAGEAANGGQPFDVLIVGGPSSFQPPRTWLSLGFNNEIGNLDGITAISVTDIGAVPEPGTLAVLGVLVAPALLARRRRR